MLGGFLPAGWAAQARRWARVVETGADVAARWNRRALPLYDAAGRRRGRATSYPTRRGQETSTFGLNFG